ncbi:MAG: restriction endonuclease [Phycisphaerales bacterium]|nr:restriction endonuclease [Phycisphaerales bacterium]
MSDKSLMPVDRVGELMHAALSELVAQGGEARGSDVIGAVGKRFVFSAVELEAYSNGTPRWETNLRFYTTNCVKAGWLRKSKGTWQITTEGRQVLSLSPGELVRESTRKYNEWNRTRSKSSISEETQSLTIETAPELVVRENTFEQAEEQSRRVIEDHLFTLSPYEFQDLVGHLLRAMGYFIAHTAPPGPDGGVDLIVYKDPLGTVAPRIKVQVKHRRESKVSSREIRELQGLIQHEEVGLMVSSGGFAKDAANEARRASKHIDQIDLERLITLWQEHYPKLSEEGRRMLPLAAIYHLAPTED